MQTIPIGNGSSFKFGCCNPSGRGVQVWLTEGSAINRPDKIAPLQIMVQKTKRVLFVIRPAVSMESGDVI